jgi:hypothetical protein
MLVEQVLSSVLPLLVALVVEERAALINQEAMVVMVLLAVVQAVGV